MSVLLNLVQRAAAGKIRSFRYTATPTEAVDGVAQPAHRGHGSATPSAGPGSGWSFGESDLVKPPFQQWKCPPHTL
eukprot:SAG11_NODE_2964_length_2806_cov_5.360547_1_plen_76_part_00